MSQQKPFNLGNLDFLIKQGVEVKKQNWIIPVKSDDGKCSVTVEIVRWCNEFGEPHWNYYLKVGACRFKKKEDWVPVFNKNQEPWNRWDDSKTKWNDIDFHGGVTYCQCETYGDLDVVKVGCDYGHYNDHLDMDYHYISVFVDAVSTARQFLKLGVLLGQEVES